MTKIFSRVPVEDKKPNDANFELFNLLENEKNSENMEFEKTKFPQILKEYARSIKRYIKENDFLENA